jgi:hypothetical protein
MVREEIRQDRRQGTANHASEAGKLIDANYEKYGSGAEHGQNKERTNAIGGPFQELNRPWRRLFKSMKVAG